MHELSFCDTGTARCVKLTVHTECNVSHGHATKQLWADIGCIASSLGQALASLHHDHEQLTSTRQARPANGLGLQSVRSTASRIASLKLIYVHELRSC